MRTPLVLLAGLLCDRFIWEPVAEQLSDTAAVSIFSFAGFNNMADMADKVLAEAPPQFVLAGHSMGGRVALEVYRKAPERVLKLALLNTGVHPVKASEIPGRQTLLTLAETQGMKAVANAWLPPMMSKRGLQNPGLMSALHAMVLRHSRADFCGEIHALLNRPNGEEVLKLLRVPTLLMSGSEDDWSPISQHREMQALIASKETQLVELEGVGHMSLVEAPDKVAAALRDWVSPREHQKMSVRE